MNQSHLLAICCAAFMLAACGETTEQPKTDDIAPIADSVACPGADENGVIEIVPGLTATIISKGYGRAAVARDYADVHTTLWLYDEEAADGRGTEIWTSGGDRPFQFMLDAGQVIKGWDLGVACMLVGETRELKIASDLAYGARGKPPVPPNATLLFNIELVKLTGSAEQNP